FVNVACERGRIERRRAFRIGAELVQHMIRGAHRTEPISDPLHVACGSRRKRRKSLAVKYPAQMPGSRARGEIKALAGSDNLLRVLFQRLCGLGSGGSCLFAIARGGRRGEQAQSEDCSEKLAHGDRSVTAIAPQLWRR